MSKLKYILKSIKHYRKQHFAILLATILSTTILSGALIVGDSVKFSLQKMVEKRLGKASFIMQTNDRFVSDSLAINMSNALDAKTIGILNLQGMAINTENNLKANSINILGVDSAFWNFAPAKVDNILSDQAYMSHNLAKRLNISAGSEILLKIHNADVIPVNAPFAQEKQAFKTLRLQVGKVLSDAELGRFSIRSDQKAPYNIFVKKAQLESKMDLHFKSNMLLLENANNKLSEGKINNIFENTWSFTDLALNIRYNSETNHTEITSDRVFIDHSIHLNLADNYPISSSLSYLVNAIQFKNMETPYSFVTGVSAELSGYNLAPNEVVLNNWCASDLGAQVGDTIKLKYFVIGRYRELQEQEQNFIIKAIEKNQQGIFNEKLMPNFPGLSDAESCSEWDTGVPIDLNKIRDKDEDYWDAFKGTPKAIISEKTAQNIWSNAYGLSTLISIPEKVSHAKLQQNIKAAQLGLHFTNVKKEGSQAVNNSISFGELFLSLSFFVIAAAILLLILIYTLNIISRKHEIALLKSLGFKQSKIQQLFVYESLLTIVFGSIIGTFLGIVYNAVILKALNSLWNDVVRTNALEIIIKPQTLFIGAAVGIIIAFFAVYIIVRRQLKKQIAHSISKLPTAKHYLLQNKIAAYALLFMGGILIIASLYSAKINTGLFLAAGGVIMLSMVLFVNLYLKKTSRLFSFKSYSISTLALKNMGRNRLRSNMAILLLALGTFSVIITGANRKTFQGSDTNRSSGTGGFLYWVENSIPIIHDLNSEKGQEVFNIADEAIMDSMEFMQFLTLDGNDASCLNLNQVSNPRILGVNTNGFAKLNPFSFTNFTADIDQSKPWEELNKTYAKGLIPAYIDQTVITWGLLKKVGDTLHYNDENGELLKIIIAGGLQSSVFQGSILVSEDNLRTYFPSLSGSKVMLIDAKKEQMNSITELLGFYFSDYGVDFELASLRLATFNSVTNTYLNVFMLLGGLGVAIGTIGFGIVLMRNKIERKTELALLSAIGFKIRDIKKLLIVEHVMLLTVGLIIGTISAFIGILPSLFSDLYSIPSYFMAWLVVLIYLTGFIAILLTSKIRTNKNLISALRHE